MLSFSICAESCKTCSHSNDVWLARGRFFVAIALCCSKLTCCQQPMFEVSSAFLLSGRTLLLRVSAGGLHASLHKVGSALPGVELQMRICPLRCRCSCVPATVKGRPAGFSSDAPGWLVTVALRKPLPGSCSPVALLLLGLCRVRLPPAVPTPVSNVICTDCLAQRGRGILHMVSSSALMVLTRN